MKCPTDGTQLVMSERSGIEIDFCPECRGVWLDRGELDKIIERSSVARNAPRAETSASRACRDNHHDSQGHGFSKKNKASWLGELFG
jgi:Zn-finger nucleic acid-binding protein